MKSYAEKFGISQEILESWKNEEIYLEGHKKVLIILIPGWSAVTRQVLPLAKRLNEAGYTVKGLKLSGHGTRPEDLEGVRQEDWVVDMVREIRVCKKSGKFDKIIIGGVSMGGNVCLLASLQEKIDGIILIGTPVHLKGQLLIKIYSKIMPLFKMYTKKAFPRNIFINERDSYQYFPIQNMKEVLAMIEESVRFLKKVVAPILILQTKNDFFVTKYSPWIIYKNVSSKIREMRWIHTNSENHVPQGIVEVDKTTQVIEQFVGGLGVD
jgi:carboxylesterase